MMKTGLNSDVAQVSISMLSTYLFTYLFTYIVHFQHALLLPVLVHHVRYHLTLQTFDERIGYVFKDRTLLQV